MTNSKNIKFAENVLERIKEAYGLDTDAALARFLDMKPNTLAMQKKRGSLNWIRIFNKCSNLDKNWLLHNPSGQRQNSSSTLVPLIKASKINPGHVSISDISYSKRVTLPAYLTTDHFAEHLNQCILVQVDHQSQPSKLNIGDVILTCTHVNQPLHNKHYLIAHEGQIRLTRKHKKSDQELLILDQESEAPISTINPTSNDVTIIGRVYWIANNL